MFTIAEKNYFKKQNFIVFNSHFYLSSVSAHGHSGHGVLSRQVPWLIFSFIIWLHTYPKSKPFGALVASNIVNSIKPPY